ncbi:MAG TPA: hypothetical protein PLK69_07035, partial [Tetrasphaera sp.]|nr:hypothetical protein [Tetrasphaera sp.]
MPPRTTTRGSAARFYGSALAIAIGLSIATTSAAAGPAAEPLVGAAAAAGSSGCRGTAYIFGVRADATLTFTTVDAASNTRLRKLTGPKLPWGVRAMATLNTNTILVTTTTGALYRLDVTGQSTKLTIAAPVQLAASGWTYDKLTADGFGHLFATGGTNGQLWRWDLGTKKPQLSDLKNKTRIGAGVLTKSLTGVGGGWLIGNTSGGQLVSIRANGEGSLKQTTLIGSGWGGVSALMSPGGGLFFARTAATGAA